MIHFHKSWCGYWCLQIGTLNETNGFVGLRTGIEIIHCKGSIRIWIRLFKRKRNLK